MRRIRLMRYERFEGFLWVVLLLGDPFGGCPGRGYLMGATVELGLFVEVWVFRSRLGLLAWTEMNLRV